jgi:HAD superfamily hydrolase (TIGR01493 family)
MRTTTSFRSSVKGFVAAYRCRRQHMPPDRRRRGSVASGGICSARFQASFDETFVDQRTLDPDSLTDTAAAFGSTCDSAAIIEKQFAHWLVPPIFPDAVPFLAQVRRLGMPICVVSNIDRRDIEAASAFHGLQFHGLVTSEGARASKPRPEMFRMALDLLGMQLDEVLHVGDSCTSDVGGATRLGIAVA